MTCCHTGLLSAYSPLSEACTQVHGYLYLTSHICLHGITTADEVLRAVLADMLLPVQKAALGVFQKFTSLPREELWHELMDVLTGLLRPEQLEQVQVPREITPHVAH